MMEAEMAESPVKKREYNPPAWVIGPRGKQRLAIGRWNMIRVSEYLQNHPTWHTLDDLARVVYGSTGKIHRDNVRKHIPSQRRYMRLNMPIVTRYSSHDGRIQAIKLYNPGDQNDRDALAIELEKMRARKEITEDTYQRLRTLWLLSG